MALKKTVSICIPAYNRPKELEKLLSSIDITSKEIEIVICEDKSPKREEIGKISQNFKKTRKYPVVYKENKENLGFDKNLKELIRTAEGKWIVFMGDDDEFVPGALDKLIVFLKDNPQLGYVLKSHYTVFAGGEKEPFRYWSSTKFFEPGVEAYTSLFRKSVFISGFTIRRDLILPYLVSDFDGTLLFQLYLLAEVVLKYPSAYFDEPLTQQNEGVNPLFGNAESEKGFYTPGIVTLENSLNFLKGFLKITRFIDAKHNLNLTPAIQLDMSKYFYPNLAIQRDKGLGTFFDYVKKLNVLGFNASVYYYLYVIFLTVFGKRSCDNAIRIIKNILGKTPSL
jgi:abequosyltransferase